MRIRAQNSKILLLLAAFSLAPIFPSVLDAAGTSAAQFLKMGAGARAAAMGDSFCAVADDVTATDWNPAGLGQIKTTQMSLMQNTGLVDTHYQYLAAGTPYRGRALGFSLYRLDHGSIDRYTAADVKDGSFDAGSLAASVTVAQEFKKGLRIGLSGKYVEESIENEKGSSFAGDFGVLLHRGRYNFAAVLQHIGPGLKMVQSKEPLPQTLRLGAAGRFFQDRLQAALDISKPNDNDATFHGGLEYFVGRRIALRAGYATTPGNQVDVKGLAGLTGGLGVAFGPISLDYAIVPFGDLGNTQIISLLLKINKI